LGWMDLAGLEEIDPIWSEKAINYSAKINRKTDKIFTHPYATSGYQFVANASEYLNRQVTVSREAVTKRTTWALISIGNKELGWIDKRGLEIDQVLSEKTVNYTRSIFRKTDTINTKPYGIEGYVFVGSSADYYGRRVNVIKEI